MRVVSHRKSEQHARGSRDTQLNPKPRGGQGGRQSAEPQRRVYVSGAKTSAVSWEKKTEGGYHGVRECLQAQPRMWGETLSRLATFLAGR